jgi:hypothetical protein
LKGIVHLDFLAWSMRLHAGWILNC